MKRDMRKEKQMPENVIHLPGISNARELGGYPAGDKYIKKGVLLRTGGLSGASPEALSILSSNFKVRTVIDFRMKTEQASRPDPDDILNTHACRCMLRSSCDIYLMLCDKHVISESCGQEK